MAKIETVQVPGRADRRDEMFEGLVTQALKMSELDDFVDSPSGPEPSYLRDRFRRERERLWKDVDDQAAAFDNIADRYDRMQRWSPITRQLNRVVTSARVPRLLAFVGLAVVSVSYLRSSPGPASLRANSTLLWAAIGMSLALIVIWSLRLEPTLTVLRLARRLGPALTVLLFTISVVTVRPATSHHPPLAVQWSFLLPFLFSLVTIALPFARGDRDLKIGFIESLAGPMVFAAGLVPILGVAVRSGGGIKRLATPLPEFAYAGSALVLIACAAILACVGWSVTPAELLTREHDRARRDLCEDMLSRVLMPFLREELNRHRPSFDTMISVTEAPGLSEVPDPIYRVHTPAAQQVAELIERMPGGSIGLAGPRGCGKTTTIESYCAKQTDPATTSVVVSAPVEYTARDFLLHLYAKVCLKVAGPASVGTFGQDPMGEAARRRQLRSLAVYALVLLLGGVVVIFGSGVELVNTTTLWGIAMLMAAVIIVAYVAAHSRTAPVGGLRPTNRSLVEIAADRLNEIRYQQTFTSTWSGTLKPPLGVEAAAGGGRSMVRQPMQLPEIVDSLREFLDLVGRERGKVLIGIDELDKMRSEQAAEQFLNEIKSVFGVRRCYYLVSVSEDAMSGFERRGLPFRDVFDSTFDEIVWFSHMGLDEAVAAIDRRVVGMPVPFKQFCYALSGGLPRDLVRSARAVLGAQHKDRATDLSTIAGYLVGQDITRKTRAIAVASRKLAAEPMLSQFLLACDRAHGEQNLAALHVQIADLGRLIEDSRVDGDEGALRQLVAELACYYYYAATLLEFFTTSAPKERWRTATPITSLLPSHLSSLAEARQAFSVNVRVAWETVSEFRKAWDLSVIPFPERGSKGAPHMAAPEQDNSDSSVAV